MNQLDSLPKANRLYRSKKLYWTDKEGNQTLVQDLGTSHLLHIINLLSKFREIPSNLLWLGILGQELINRSKDLK